ncbi:MAG: hypothetical protein NVSMB14_05360 [Isosphaeraceae bacterium]
MTARNGCRTRGKALLASLICIVAATSPGAFAQEHEDELAKLPPQARAAAFNGIAFLRKRAAAAKSGEAAIGVLALFKAGVKPNDEDFVACIDNMKARFSGSQYNPQLNRGSENYEAGVMLMTFASIDPKAYGSYINSLANYLITHQKANGSWDYSDRNAGDMSMTQYALLGLWEAASANVNIPPEVWDRAANWIMSVQAADGGWNYHRDEPQMPPGMDTISMTAAGVAGVLICKEQLTRFMKGGDAPSNLLVNANPDNPQQPKAGYRASVSGGALLASANKGLAWIGQYYKPSNDNRMGQSVFYGLYGMERAGALVQKATIGNHDWFNEGLQYVVEHQEKDGHYVDDHGDVPNTAWAVLFLTRSTKQTLFVHNQRLGKGTLLGGRGLPKDLTKLTFVGGRLSVRPLNAGVDRMLAVLEDVNNIDDVEGALQGLQEQYVKVGPQALKPYKDRFRRMLSNPDPGLRRVAAWCIARTADIDAVPPLIAALNDSAMAADAKDPAVMDEAKRGLQFLSRKIEGYGPPPNATLDQRKESMRKWREWYEAVRPVDLAGQDNLDEIAPLK